MTRNQRRKELRDIEKDKNKILTDPDLLRVLGLLSMFGKEQSNQMFHGKHPSTVNNYLVDCEKPKLEKLYVLEKRKQFLEFEAKRNLTKLTSRHAAPQEDTPDHPMGEQIF